MELDKTMECFITHDRSDVKTLCCIVFVRHTLRSRSIKVALFEYVIKRDKLPGWPGFAGSITFSQGLPGGMYPVGID